MADIRIKDLTTTASSSASDDFIAIDGTTNGTRKLNAFSPTFGGNAVVTGTLTVNGTGGNTFAGPLIGQGTTVTGYQVLAKDTGGTAVGAAYALQTSGGTDKWRWGLRGSAGSLTDSLIFSYLSGSWADALTLSNAGVVSIPATTASTTTSTGALVIGNGTSGGLGVGGAMYIGGLIESSSGSGIRIRTASGTAPKFSTIQTGWVTWEMQNKASSTNLSFTADGSVDALTLSNAGVVSVPASTASTSTSSGALVVSGGVGVAEQIHAKYYTATSNIVAGFTANTHVLDYYSGTARNVVFGPDASTIGNWKLQLLRSDASASIDALTVSNAGNGVFYGSVKTGTPAGGTAAAWKLGTVATVSPTSPNRTIEVDIGGTIYYIHAKTTNN